MGSIFATKNSAIMIALTHLWVVSSATGEASENETAEIDPVCKTSAELGEGPGGKLETKALPSQFKEFLPFIHSDERLLMVACMTVPERPGIRYLMATKAPRKVGSVSILDREPDGSLRLEAVNHTVVQIDGDEGSGEAGRFHSVWSTLPGVFLISNSSGDRCNYTERYFEFLYSPATNSWLLNSTMTNHAGDDAKGNGSTTRTADDFGQITFTQFDGRKYGIIEYSQSRGDAANSRVITCP